MKYWLITTEYPPFYGGGISTYCYHTACMLSENGHEVTVFINDKSVNDEQIETRQEARIIRFNPDKDPTDSFLGTTTHLSHAFSRILKKFIESEGKPDIIESQDYNGIAYFLMQSKACLDDWCKNIPVVITMHSPSFLYFEYNEVPVYKAPNFWIGEMERFCIQAADLLISPSRYLVDELKKRFIISNANLHIVVNPYHAVNSNTIENSNVLNNALNFYGKLSAQKGTFKILEQFQQLWDKGFGQSFTMIGGQDIVFHPEGKTMGNIVRKKYKKYIDNGLLKFKKEIAPNEREAFLNTAIIFIIPSIVDNLPYVVLELMSLGKIVIVSKQGGQAEITTDGEDGFIFNYEEPASFERVVKQVLNLSKEQRTEISKKAIQKIQNNFNYKHVYLQKIKLLEEVIAKYKIPAQFPFIRKKDESIFLSNKIYSDTTLLSVVVPYYNLGEYVDDAIQSILNSTYKNIEILLINDGSSDPASIEKLKQYNGNPKIKVVNKKNTGLSDTRNKGAEMAQGDFLAFLDADDKVSPLYYEKAVRILCQYKNVHFVGAWTQYFGMSTAIWPTFNPEAPLLLTQNLINSSALVYKREAFLASGLNDGNFKIGLEDYESVIHLKTNGFNGIAIPEILFYYRVRKNSMIKRVDKEVRAAYFAKIAEKHISYFTENDKEIKNLIQFNSTPLSSDNATLDDFPFQQFPFVGKLVRKLIRTIKANPSLKRGALFIKKSLQRQ